MLIRAIIVSFSSLRGNAVRLFPCKQKTHAALWDGARKEACRSLTGPKVALPAACVRAFKEHDSPCGFGDSRQRLGPGCDFSISPSLANTSSGISKHAPPPVINPLATAHEKSPSTRTATSAGALCFATMMFDVAVMPGDYRASKIVSMPIPHLAGPRKFLRFAQRCCGNYRIVRRVMPRSMGTSWQRREEGGGTVTIIPLD